ISRSVFADRSSMTYGEFLALFLLPPLLLLGVWSWRTRGKFPPSFHTRPLSTVLGFLVGVAVLYTTPWDNYLVAKGIWSYPKERVWGIRLGWVPLEEYLFFVLQTLLTGLWVVNISRHENRDDSLRLRSSVSMGTRWGVAFGIGSLLSTAWLFWGASTWERATYMSLILGWALPVVLGQWLLGGAVYLRHWKIVCGGVSLPTLYLWVADTLAIRQGIWHITESTALGIHLPGGLPVEEAVFFFLTNLMVVLGVLLVYAFPDGSRFSYLWRRWRK
ncbi:MAG: lycopene cyclase domain-containing protein, partial [Bacteroidia bacterium]|nr:lycopene cyclase domain-containing protein [Bacteroidia bacterium]